MVLDGWALKPTDRVVFGVNQAQKTESDKWWSAELDAAAADADQESRDRRTVSPEPES